MGWDLEEFIMMESQLGNIRKAVETQGDGIATEVSLLSNDLTGIRNAIEDLNATLTFLMQLLMDLNKSLKSNEEHTNAR
jgi:hypothetical protein